MFDGIVDYILKAVEGAWNWIVESITALLDPLLQPVVDSIPSLNDEMGQLLTYCAYDNEWIALNYGLMLLGAWSVFHIAYITYRHIKSWLPFVGS